MGGRGGRGIVAVIGKLQNPDKNARIQQDSWSFFHLERTVLEFFGILRPDAVFSIYEPGSEMTNLLTCARKEELRRACASWRTDQSLRCP